MRLDAAETVHTGPDLGTGQLGHGLEPLKVYIRGWLWVDAAETVHIARQSHVNGIS